MKNIGETHSGDDRATWVLNVRVPSRQGEHEILLGDCRLDFLVNETRATLRCTIKVQIPTGDITERRSRPGWGVPLNMEFGIFSLTCPLTSVEFGRELSVAVRRRPGRVELFVDGILVDEEWPFTPLRGEPVVVRSDLVKRAEVFNCDLSDAELFAKIPAPDEKRATALLGKEDQLPQYWRPRGHNTTAGDVMLCVHKGELHLFYLHDRRKHGSKWMAGAHQFYHLSSADLRTWKQHPPAIPIDEPWEAIGTGTCVSDGERMVLFYEQHGERYLSARSRRGMWMATSDDGEHFTKHQNHCMEIVQPGVYKTDTWNVISGQKRYTSADLKTWTLAEAHFLAEQSGMSNECPCYFQFGSWHYILMGRTGFFMSRSSAGPFWKHPAASSPVTTPAWDIYDGLMVPMAATFKGRLILAGWVGCYDGAGWGGVLVVRELQQRADGNLEIRWLPELIPAGGEWRVLAESLPPASTRALPAATSFHLKFDVKPSETRESFAIRLGDAAKALELRFEPAQRRIQWGVSINGNPAPESRGLAADAEDFAITNVEGIDRHFSVELIVKRLPTGTVIDAAFSFGRTIITRRGALNLDAIHATGTALNNVAYREIE